MRNRSAIPFGLTLALLILVAVASVNAGEVRRQPRGAAAALLRSPSFNVSGEFSGSLNGGLVIGGVPYPLAQNAQAFEIGRGPIPLDSVIGDRFVFLSGIQLNGVAVITSVIVRPAEDPSKSGTELDDAVTLRASNTDE